MEEAMNIHPMGKPRTAPGVNAWILAARLVLAFVVAMIPLACCAQTGACSGIIGTWKGYKLTDGVLRQLDISFTFNPDGTYRYSVGQGNAAWVSESGSVQVSAGNQRYPCMMTLTPDPKTVRISSNADLLVVQATDLMDDQPRQFFYRFPSWAPSDMILAGTWTDWQNDIGSFQLKHPAAASTTAQPADGEISTRYLPITTGQISFQLPDSWKAIELNKEDDDAGFLYHKNKDWRAYKKGVSWRFEVAKCAISVREQSLPDGEEGGMVGAVLFILPALGPELASAISRYVGERHGELHFALDTLVCPGACAALTYWMPNDQSRWFSRVTIVQTMSKAYRIGLRGPASDSHTESVFQHLLASLTVSEQGMR
jgi:hypothetical protein